jgi:putative aldouronate transport system permease protein
MVEDRSLGSRLVSVVSYTALGVFTILCLLPLWLVVIASFTEENSLVVRGYRLWAQVWSLTAYQFVFKGTGIRIAYQVSIFVTVVGTLGSLVIMAGLAYMLSAKHFQERYRFAFYVYFTMVFSGGLIPWFITMRMLGLVNNIWALIVPMLVNPWWVLVLRNFFGQLPVEITEAARIDGASDASILFRIILPLSLPAMATVGLFTAVAYWNDWFHGVMLLPLADFRPLATLLLRMMRQLMALQEAVRAGADVPLTQLPALSVRMATTVVTVGPIILLYPFVQRYFIRGLVLGSVKS